MLSNMGKEETLTVLNLILIFIIHHVSFSVYRCLNNSFRRMVLLLISGRAQKPIKVM